MREKTLPVRIPISMYKLFEEQARKAFIPVSAEVAGRLAESLTKDERDRIEKERQR